jgi:hypothetical protein
MGGLTTLPYGDPAVAWFSPTSRDGETASPGSSAASWRRSERATEFTEDTETEREAVRSLSVSVISVNSVAEIQVAEQAITI